MSIPTSAIPKLRATWRDYLALTKPRIIELLLVTTVPTMVFAADGWPPLSIAVATLVGGAFAAGGANVLNCHAQLTEPLLRVSLVQGPQ